MDTVLKRQRGGWAAGKFIIQTTVSSLFLVKFSPNNSALRFRFASFPQGSRRSARLGVDRGVPTETRPRTRGLLSHPFMHSPRGMFSLAADPLGFLQLLKSFLCAPLQALMPADSPFLTPSGNVH